MSKVKSKTVSVDLENGQKVNIVVKKPSSQVLNKAQNIGAKVWSQALRDGVFTKATLAQFMRQNGTWSDDHDKEEASLNEKIYNAEKELAVGSGGRRLKVSEGKEKSLNLRRLRNQLRDLISERISLESNTAEGLSENAKFNYLVSKCTFYEDGRPVYSGLDDYDSRSDDEIAFQAAATLAELIYQLDQGYEANLPENQFLKKFNLVNEDLSLVNNKGELVDIDGSRINEKGWFINEKGERISKDGLLLSDSGHLVLQAEFENDLDIVTPAEKEEKPATVTSQVLDLDS